MPRGVLLALEGIDGSGKTTQARLLAAALKRLGHSVVLTREPTAGPWGRKLRLYLQGPVRDLSPEEELGLFIADRRDHVQKAILPGLAAGKIIITDRYYYSSVAYQGALGLDPGLILARNEAFAPRPDLVFILLVPVSHVLVRLGQSKRQGRQVSEEPGYLERVAAIYAGLQGPGILQVDASAPPETVHAALLAATLKALGK